MLRYIPQYQLSAPYPIYSMYVTVYTAVPTGTLLPNIQYVNYAIYRSTYCHPLTQNTVCILRYIQQYQLSPSYPIYSMYITLYTAVPSVTLLSNMQYVYYAIYRNTKYQPLTQYAVCILRFIPQYKQSASYPINSMYIALYTAVPNVSLLPDTQYVCYAIYRNINCQSLTQYTLCMLLYIPQ